MKKKAFSLLLILGICLVLVSLCITVIFLVRTHIGAQKRQQVISQLHKILPERTAGIPGSYPSAGMPVLEVDGKDYVALLEAPAFGITLPVADQWDGGRISASPARFWGSAYDNSLVIGGMDDPRQFAFCDKIENGDLVTLTDMTGAVFSYRVSDVDRAKHAETQWLLDGENDLTLFCFDFYSMEYIAVRCVSAFA